MSATATQTPLKIHELRVENVMGVRAITLAPKDGLTVIGGENGAGKSSTIDSIWFALGGKPSARLPIRKGEEEATITLDLGDLIVERRFYYGPDHSLKSTLKVSNRDGANFSRPQELLDRLISKFAFDPFEFTRLKPREQVERLKAVLGIDDRDILTEKASAEESRKLINAQLAALKARFTGTPDEVKSAPDAEIDTAPVMAEIEAAAAGEADARRLREVAEGLQARWNAAHDDIGRVTSRIAAIVKELEELEARKASLEATRNKVDLELALAKKAATDFAAPDASEARERLAEIERTNRLVSAKRSYNEGKAEWTALEAKRLEAQKTIDEADAKRQALIADALAKAAIAVPGIAWTDEGLEVGGVPFEQVNTAAQLAVSVALALHENPRLRAFRIGDGEKVTPTTMRQIEEIARAHDAQIFVELACTRDDVEKGFREVSFFIEDGELAEVSA